jgi:hypothetical protein
LVYFRRKIPGSSGLPSADAAEVGSADGLRRRDRLRALLKPSEPEHFHKEPHREREYGDDKQRPDAFVFEEREFSKVNLAMIS